MTDRPGECVVCGHPGLRSEGHAWWCESLANSGLLDIDVCGDCGREFRAGPGLDRHRAGVRCPGSMSVTP